MASDQPQTNTPNTPPDAAAHLADALHRGMNATVLYASEHPAVAQAADDAANALRQLRSTTDNISLAITADGLLYTEQPITPSASIKGLAKTLHTLDAAAIEFRPPGTPDTFHTLISALVHAQKQWLRGPQLAEHIESATKGATRIVPLNYDGLRLAEGTRKPTEESEHPPQVTWADLVRSVLGGVAPGGNVSGADLAGAANAAFSDAPDQAVDTVRGQLQALAQAAQSQGASERATTLEELRSFVSGLDPSLRQTMMQVDPAKPNASLSLLGEMAETLPVHEVVDALRTAEAESHEVSGEALRLFKRLAHVTADDPEQNQRLQQTAGQWRVMRGEGGESVATSLQELMQLRDSSEFSPEDYQKRLDEISKSVQKADTSADYVSQLDAVTTKTHAVAIAVNLLEDGAAAEDRGAEIMDYVSTSFDHLIDEKEFELVHSAVRAANLFLGGQGDEDARKAAQRLLAGLQSKDRIHRIVQLGCTNTGACEEALALLRAAGPIGLRYVTDLLGDNPPQHIRAALESVIRESTGEQLHRVVRELEKGDTHVSRTVVAMVRTVGSERGLPLLEPLLTNIDPDVRHEAYRVLAEVGGAWPERILRSGLGEEDPKTQAIVIEQLIQSSHEDEQSLQLMGAYLEGTLSGRLPDPEHFMNVVNALAVRGQAGISRLCSALRFLGRRPNPRNIVLVTRLAEALREYRSESIVRGALLRWRVSPAYLLSIVLLGGSEGKATNAEGRA